jgi:cytochrome c
MPIILKRVWTHDSFSGQGKNCELMKQLVSRWRLPIVGLLGLALGISGTLLAPRWVQELKTACALPDDAARGKAWAHTCEGCHDIAASTPAIFIPGSKSSGGPNLQNVYGSLAGTTPAPFNPTQAYNHPYPPLAAARDAGVVWTDENLFLYLRGPKQFLEERTGKSFDAPLLYMQFFIGGEAERRDVIAYLRAIKGHPECD